MSVACAILHVAHQRVNRGKDFVDGALGGSASPFVAYLAEDARLSAEDVARLKRLVDELEAGGKGKAS